MARYLLIGPEGEIEQVCTREDLTPADDGSNPQGWREVEVERHSDDLEAETFDEEGEEWVPVLAALQARKWAEAKTRRDALENGVAVTPLGAVQCDDRSKLKISGIVIRADRAWRVEEKAAEGEGRQPDPSCFEETFTLADNTTVALNAFTAGALGEAVADHISAVYATTRALRAMIFAENASVADVLAIDIEGAPWPDPESGGPNG